MAKYARGPMTHAVFMANEVAPGRHAELEQVIVLPEADWREMVAAISACGGKGSGDFLLFGGFWESDR